MTAIASQVHAHAALDVRAVILPRAEWTPRKNEAGRIIGFEPVPPGTWYGLKCRARAAHLVTVVAFVSCPACGSVLSLAHNREASLVLKHMTGMPVPVTHQISYLGEVSPDLRHDQFSSCTFHQKVYLDRWNKTKALYAIAYVEGLRGKIQIDYTHAIDRKEARFHFGARKNVRIIDMAPAVGFYVDEKTGRMTCE